MRKRYRRLHQTGDEKGWDHPGSNHRRGRAGETVTEFILAMKYGLKAADLAGAIHPYPTYSTAAQQMSADLAVEGMLSGTSGTLIRGLSKLIR